VTRHDDAFERAQRVTPGGVHSPVRAFRGVGGTPIFGARGHGAHLIDVTGRVYVDFCLSFGPLMLGHADPIVADAARAAINDGWTLGTADPYSLELAEWIAARVRWAERIRFVTSGTEAVMTALRLARAATARERVLKFEGCYHGHSDAMLVKAGSGLAGTEAASSAGVPHGVVADTLVLPLDDEAALSELFAREAPTLAAAIIEPLPANYGLLPQRAEWLTALARLCREHAVVLILDEVISGFRIGRGGMAERLGLAPDLVCYGKVIGGGFPVGACAGRADLMDRLAPSGPVYQAGTLSANPVAMRAGLTTLAEVERRDGWQVLTDTGDAFAKALGEALPAGLDVVHEASIFWIRVAADGPVRRPDRIPARHHAWYAAFFHAALERGIYLPPSPYEVAFLSLAHDSALLSDAIGELAAAAAVATTKVPIR